MLVLFPLLIIILIIVAINNIYYSDVKPKDIKNTQQIEKKLDSQDISQDYLDKYIKK